MARNVWKSYVKVYLAVETLKSIHSRGLKIPKELIEAYKQKTRNSGAELVAEFFERLSKESPELIGLFLQTTDDNSP